MCGAAAWGSVGHQTTAAIATQLLTDKAKDTIASILPSGETLVSVATWADDVKHEKAYQWSAPLHYIDTKDYACNYDYTRDCVDTTTGQTGFCVAGAIQNYTQQAQRSRVSLHRALAKRGLSSTDDRLVPLKFLVHFLGDIHQPLHVGFTSDRGGNEIFVDYFGVHVNLHAIWDENIIADILKNNFSSSATNWANELVRRVKSGGEWYTLAQQWGACNTGGLDCTAAMATESIKYACGNSYECISSGSNACAKEAVVENPDLSTEYYNQAAPVINLRIAQGGVRLAALLNHIFQ